jgi:hypothetical protein
MPESVFTQTMPLLFAGGVCGAAVVLAGVVVAGAALLVVVLVGVVVVVLDAPAAVLAVDAGALFVGVVDFDAGVVDVAVVPAGAELSAVLVDFLDLVDFLVPPESPVVVVEDVLTVDLSLPVPVEAFAVSVFFDLEDFLAEESLLAVAVASLVFLVEDFFAEAVSEAVSLVAEDSAVPAFFDLEDFFVLELSVDVSSVAGLLLLLFVVLLWSLDWASWALEAARSEMLPATSNRAVTTASTRDWREPFMVRRSFYPEQFRLVVTAVVDVFWGGKQ